MSDRLVVTRDLSQSEFPWLPEPVVSAGTVVYRYHGHTYGVIAPGGIAVSYIADQTPFFEVPADAVSPEQVPDRIIVPVANPTAQMAVDALVKFCNRGFDDGWCPICFGESPDCSPTLEFFGCQHGWDCPWLLVLATATREAL